VKKWIVWAAVALVLAACSAHSRRGDKNQLPPSATTVEGLAAAVKAESRRSDEDLDSKTRTHLAMQASADADACVRLAPHAAACLYSSGIAMGLQARAFESVGSVSLLSDMLEMLGKAESADPDYDDAGPARVQALVLLRAPGWPLGPGDPQTGLDAARRAVALFPDFIPNRLALAEAQLKTGDTNGARESYTRARDAAQALPAAPDRNDWLKEANDALQGR
jgi:hypothetical protein